MKYRVSLFIKNIILPFWRSYQSIKKRNKLYYNPDQFNKEEPRIKETPIPFKNVYQPKIEDNEQNSMIMKDFEYVDHLYQEIQYLVNDIAPKPKTITSNSNREITPNIEIQNMKEEDIPKSSEQEPKSFGKGKKNPSQIMNRLANYK